MSLTEAIEIHNPFVDNKYTKWYMEIVSQECNDEYTEKHHILPKSLFPEYKNSSWNIVKLSARKHFISHMLLFRMFKFNTKEYGSMLKASQMMGRHSTNNRYMNSRLYEVAKIKCSNYLSENQRWSEEHKQRISNTLKLKGIIRGPMSVEHKEKMIASKKARYVPKIWMNKNGIQNKVVYEKIDEYLLNGWTKGTSKKHLTEEYSEKMKNIALLQWKKLKASGYTNLNRT